MTSHSPLLAVLGDRDKARSFTPEQWSLLFSEARASGLTPRLASVLDGAPCLASMPVRFSDHLLAASIEGKAIARDTTREFTFLKEALADIKTPVVVLKGAAYVLAGLPPSRGRLFSDIDILVDRSAIPDAESALMLAGWVADKKSTYDQRYYREWSHEIPPLTHVQRGTTVDLHHSLVMPTCRIRIDSASMVANAVPLDDLPGWYRLADEDMVLHAAAHLLLNSEFDRGLRDLGDIDLLIRHFSAPTPDFIDRVVQRAERVGMGSLIGYALAICKKIYRTPLSARAVATIRADTLSLLLATSVTTRHPDTRPATQAVSDLLLAWREMALRLPPSLLARHLWHKLEQTVSGKGT